MRTRMQAVYRTFVLSLLIVPLIQQPGYAQHDSTSVAPESTSVRTAERIYELPALLVTARQLDWSSREVPVDKDDLNRVIERGGVDLIRRGIFLASDVYVDGFKRGDVEVVIDGERYPNACPNRMDPPTTRVNPMEMELIELDRSTASLQSGIGGKISYHRSHPSNTWLVKGGLAWTGSSGQGLDAALSIENHGQRFTAQIIRGEPYETASGASFADLYGYTATNQSYSMVETSFHGKVNLWEYGGFVSFTEDIPFPYLRMDERYNRVWGAFASYRGNKIYLNRTRHLMDNELRGNVAMMFMESDATNLTAGLTGSWYEVYYRSWNLWNTFEPRGKASWPVIYQHMMPDLRVVSASAIREANLGRIHFTGKIGLNRMTVSDRSRLVFFKPLYGDVDEARWFVPFGATASYSITLPGRSAAGLLAEIGSEPPTPEFLYISVQKPMKNPAWAGNPELKAPVKAALRAALGWENISAEVYASHVTRYIYLNKAVTPEGSFVTYSNVNAFLTGLTVRGEWPYGEFRAAYTWAQNRTADRPLADIAPLSFTAMVRTPAWNGLWAHIQGRLATRQSRIDESLGELATPSWHQIDAGASFDYRRARFSASVLNLTNELYHQHLSYLRDPFASGDRVIEPGRTIRLSARFAY